jgi:hypothetical protein
MTAESRTRPVISVGGAPSSGTTLLADLLDSVPGLACGPELGFLAVAEAYEWSRDFVAGAADEATFPSLSPYSAPRTFFNTKYLELLEFDKVGLADMIDRSVDLSDFVDRYRQFREQVRGRPIDVMVEKTPVNVASAAMFLEAFPQGHFVHVIRDPRHVVGSLIHRGFGLAEATVIWSQQVVHGARLKDHPRVSTVTYAELLSDPFETATRIAQAVGVDARPNVVRSNFECNAFRARLPRVKSWRTPKFQGAITQFDDDRLTEMERGWVERQSLWTAWPTAGVQFLTSVGLLSAQLGLPTRMVPKVRFDIPRLQATFKQFARAGGAYDRQFVVTDPKSVIGIPRRLSTTTPRAWRVFLDSARPWISVGTLEQIAMQATQRDSRESNGHNEDEEKS